MFKRKEKLIFRRTSDSLLVSYDNQSRFCLDTIHLLFCISDSFSHKFILSILNSKLLNFLYRVIVPEIGKAFAEVKIINLKKLPIKQVSINDQQPFILRADNMLQLNKDLQEQTHKFISLLQSDFKLEKPSKKIEEFYTLTWTEFEKELSKNKITLLGVSKDDWFDRFERFKKQALELKTKIILTDKEIDRMVYELYGLTDEEIQIVENS
jgi:hypothetical protein